MFSAPHTLSSMALNTGNIGSKLTEGCFEIVVNFFDLYVQRKFIGKPDEVVKKSVLLV